MTDEKILDAFHTMWDEFPGLARLIDKDHVVIAANPIAEKNGFTAGAVCAKLGDPAIHRGCKHHAMFQTGEAQWDNVMPDRIRGWMPVKGHPDLCVHFAISIPDSE